MDRLAKVKEYLGKLSRLGNEPHIGNSDGNIMAQKTLSELTAYMEAPKDKDRYHYGYIDGIKEGYAACKKEFEDNPNHSNLCNGRADCSANAGRHDPPCDSQKAAGLESTINLLNKEIVAKNKEVERWRGLLRIGLNIAECTQGNHWYNKVQEDSDVG